MHLLKLITYVYHDGSVLRKSYVIATSVDSELHWGRKVGHGVFVRSRQTDVDSLARELAQVQHFTRISLLDKMMSFQRLECDIMQTKMSRLKTLILK